MSGYLITSLKANLKPLPQLAEWGWWYQYYFATERGPPGYSDNRHAFNKLIWKNVSPKWIFDDATLDRTAASFNNPDHVSIVIHNCRWRLSLAEGEPQYDALEQKLGEGPPTLLWPLFKWLISTPGDRHDAQDALAFEARRRCVSEHALDDASLALEGRDWPWARSLESRQTGLRKGRPLFRVRPLREHAVPNGCAPPVGRSDSARPCSSVTQFADFVECRGVVFRCIDAYQPGPEVLEAHLQESH